MGYTGSYQKWINLVFPDLYQNIHKKPSLSILTGFIWMVRLVSRPIFERIVTLKILDCFYNTCYIQNGDEDMRSRLGDPL